MADTDLAARIAEAAALIEARLDEAEESAHDAARGNPGPWSVDKSWIKNANGETVVHDEYHWGGAAFEHIARNDPARALRRVKSTRDLVAEILAEQHIYVDGDAYFSCSQAVERGEDDAEPGSACYDDDRAGKPCDCGRDARVARLLGIIASEWDDGKT